MPRSNGRLATGGLVAAVGLLLLLGTTGVLPTASLWDWFPALFVALGVWALVRSGFQNVTGPVMLVAVTGGWLLSNLGVLPPGTLGTYWPAYLVLFGVLIVVGRSRRTSRHGTTTDGDLSAFSVFGGGRTNVATEAFVGGDVVTVFGESDVDLRDATVTDPPAVVEVVTLFGETELRVPEDWTVKVDTLGIFGTTEDKRRATGDAARGTGEPDLVVTGVVTFGTIELLD